MKRKGSARPSQDCLRIFSSTCLANGKNRAISDLVHAILMAKDVRAASQSRLILTETERKANSRWIPNRKSCLADSSSSCASQVAHVRWRGGNRRRHDFRRYGGVDLISLGLDKIGARAAITSNRVIFITCSAAPMILSSFVKQKSGKKNQA